MDNPKYGVIVEGKSEKAIFNLLLSNNKLICKPEDILIGNPCTTRNGKTYCDRNLKLPKKVIIIRILDSKKENFKYPLSYEKKIEKIINVYTKPEIEMLIIHAEDIYSEFKKSNLKPSLFLKKHNNKKYKNCKSEEFINDYFSDVEILINAILKYESCTQEKGIGFTQIIN